MLTSLYVAVRDSATVSPVRTAGFANRPEENLTKNLNHA